MNKTNGLKYLQLGPVVHVFRVLYHLIVGQMLERFLSGQAHHFPQSDGERPDAARASVPVLYSRKRAHLYLPAIIIPNDSRKIIIGTNSYQQNTFPRQPSDWRRRSAAYITVILLVKVTAHRYVGHFHGVRAAHQTVPGRQIFVHEILRLEEPHARCYLRAHVHQAALAEKKFALNSFHLFRNRIRFSRERDLPLRIPFSNVFQIFFDRSLNLLICLEFSEEEK